MSTMEAIQIIEGNEDAEETSIQEAWQYLIDKGVVWQLQGFYGKTAKQLIEAGVCTPAAA